VLYPVFSTDPSVVTVDYDFSGSNMTLLLKGIKAGSAELSIVYRDDASFYYCAPIQVVVSTGSTNPETGHSGGGGCHTGYGSIGLLFVGVILRKYSNL
jgi:hypothetical protein